MRRSTEDLPPTIVERRMAEERAKFALEAKYPLRENAVLTTAQLEALRARPGDAAPVVGRQTARAKAKHRRAVDANERRLLRALKKLGL